MNIAFMRYVDYWIGIPLTVITTALVWILDRVRPAVDFSKRQRVLFIELTEMGSAILADPAMCRVATRHDIFFVIFKRNVSSLHLLQTVPKENIFTIRDDSFWVFFKDTLHFLVWCRLKSISAVIDLELFARFTATLCGFSGARARIGFYLPRSEGLYRGNVFTHKVAYNPHIHIAKNFIALTEPLLAASWPDPLLRRVIGDDEIRLSRAEPSPAAIENLRQQLIAKHPVVAKHRNLFLVNINAGDFLPQRKWPPGHFRQLIHAILERHSDMLVLMTGSPKERPSVEAVASQVASPRCVNIAGDVLFEQLPALYAMAQGMLTNDSGPAHFASVVGLRTYILFGPETPKLYSPLGNSVSIYAGLACSPCVYVTNHRNTPCTDNQCLKQIAPETVYKTISQDLFSKGEPRSQQPIA